MVKNNKKEIIEKLKEICEKEKDIKLAFIFGSFALDKEMLESDIDIAIYLEKKWSLKKINEFWRNIDLIVNKNSDLIILNNVYPTIAWAAIRGIPLKIKDYDFYIDYMLKISSEAEDNYDYAIDFLKWRKKVNVSFK